MQSLPVQKAVQSLPVESAEEARQETVRIIKSASKPRDNLTRTERATLRNLKNNSELTILPADKGNATVILNTTDYKQKINTLLEDSAYRRLTKDPTESTERKTTKLLKQSTLSEEMWAFNTQTPVKYPQDNLSLLQHGESLKTRNI